MTGGSFAAAGSWGNLVAMIARSATLAASVLAASVLAATVLSASLALTTVPAAAQVGPTDPHDPREGLVKPPDQLPEVPRDERNRNIDFLFGALKVAPDDASAKAVEDRIWALWASSGSDTANLLMSRAKKAADDEEFDLSIRLLSAVIELDPGFTEAWNRRATVYFLQKDYVNAAADIAKVLAREPRHFGALAGLGLILQDTGDDRHALQAYRRALEVYPRLKGIDEKVKALTQKVDGKDI